MIKESIFLFLAVGMVMPYLLSGTANGEYVVVNLNSTWDGEHVVLTGKVNVYNPILNKTFPGGFNKTTYSSYFTLWCSEFSGAYIEYPEVQFTTYSYQGEDLPALKIYNGSNEYAYFDLQYMIPLQGKMFVSQGGQVILNNTFYLKQVPSMIKTGYQGDYKEYTGKIESGSHSIGNFLVASPDAKIRVSNVNNCLEVSIVDKHFAVLVLNTTSNAELSKIAEVDINGSPYYIAPNGVEVNYIGNTANGNVSFPFQAFYVSHTGLLLIDYPYSGNITVVFGFNVNNPTVSLSSSLVGNNQLQILYFVIIPIIIITILLLLIYRHKHGKH
ncbi:hypothetical protein [Sulfuracidifex metallicus]|uniref:Uncharacterized protein n=1 Tax=Sulfuracidifex metallicus DSM 6482 = JCM 9184 TaxID=523847 RepID=A0A6A9QLK6_SULME|nr:hypothetical protein [Sulfuracidifex metallicus]MUN29180.1 hypothetical protein [Sulfuracidifex metallicus DSM 6482 = JCM 9184]